MAELKEVIHKECGKIAMYCKDRQYYIHEFPRAEDFFKLDKSECVPFERIVCGSCKEQIALSLDESTNTVYAGSGMAWRIKNGT